MSEATLNWFHCGRCGGLFQSPAEMAEGRTCAHCGANPSIGVVETTLPVTGAQLPEQRRDEQTPPAKTRGKRGARKNKNSYVMAKLMLGWTIVLGMIVVGAHKLWHAEPPARAKVEPAGETLALSAEDRDLMNKAGPLCGAVFQRFLEAGTPEARNQFVSTPVKTVSRMVHFYSLNPVQNIPVETLKFEHSGLVRLPDGDAYEMRWSTEDGKTIDAVFLKENEEWRLDWEHFIRYSDYPWALFLAGSGPDEGEFRLLARERLAEERKNEPDISILLHAPRFGAPAESGQQSPEFLVSRNTRDGQLLDAAFELARSGKKVFAATMPDINPERMIRVRLKVRRSTEDDVRKFEITGVTACHWYSVEDPGVEPLVRQPVPDEE